MYKKQIVKVPIDIFMMEHDIEDLGLITSSEIKEMFNEWDLKKRYTGPDASSELFGYRDRDDEYLYFLGPAKFDEEKFLAGLEDIYGEGNVDSFVVERTRVITGDALFNMRNKKS